LDRLTYKVIFALPSRAAGRTYFLFAGGNIGKTLLFYETLCYFGGDFSMFQNQPPGNFEDYFGAIFNQTIPLV
jgi:hypothetical protein